MVVYNMVKGFRLVGQGVLDGGAVVAQVMETETRQSRARHEVDKAV